MKDRNILKEKKENINIWKISTLGRLFFIYDVIFLVAFKYVYPNCSNIYYFLYSYLELNDIQSYSLYINFIATIYCAHYRLHHVS